MVTGKSVGYFCSVGADLHFAWTYKAMYCDWLCPQDESWRLIYKSISLLSWQGCYH